MNVSSKIFHEKLRELRPDIAESFTPKVFIDICEQPAVQPFLNWFCKNVTEANVLSEEEMLVKEKIEKAGEWLQGKELDAALEEATRDCPQLLKIVTLNIAEADDLAADYEMMKESVKEDEDYLETLKNSIKNLKELESNLDEEIETAETVLQREEIDMDRAYRDCSDSLEKFDSTIRQFGHDIEHLVNTYANAAENKGPPILWTQMPINQFVKQMEMYNDHLLVHVKRQFGDANLHESTSGYVSLMNESKEKTVDERIQELMLCKTNLIASRSAEIRARIAEKSCIGMLEYVKEIYNNGNLKLPLQSRLKDEMLELTHKKNILEENNDLLREKHLSKIINQWADVEILNVVKDDAYARLERRKVRLDNLKNLLLLTREQGHAHSDLLCMLMELQCCKLKEITEFVPDARHYLDTEYSLSSMRCESMQQQQEEYINLITAVSPHNSFEQLFIAMMYNDEAPQHSLNDALTKYNELISNNKEKHMILESNLSTRMNQLVQLNDEITSNYNNEAYNGATVNFTPISYELSTQHSEVLSTIANIQENITEIRTTLKERMKSNTGLEREKQILWQKFLADPDDLKTRYRELKHMADKSHFGMSPNV